MAEFCLDCLNRQINRNYTKRDVVLEKNLCEGCGEVKPCVIGLRRRARVKCMIQDFLDTQKQLRKRHPS